MTKRNVPALKAALTNGSHGRRFTDDEDQIIVDMMTQAKTSGETVSVADIKNALKDHNHAQNQESRKRAAVVNAIDRLAKAEKVDKDVLSKESNGREPYTQEEDAVLFDTLESAAQAGKQISIPDLHKALKESGKSPKERSVPSVRAHINNLLNKSDEATDEVETDDDDAEDIA